MFIGIREIGRIALPFIQDAHFQSIRYRNGNTFSEVKCIWWPYFAVTTAESVQNMKPVQIAQV